MRAPHATAIRRRQSCWPWYYIYNYNILHIELRESQTATITFSSMPQFTPDCTALSLTAEPWLAVTLHMSLSYHAVERWLAVITTKTCRRFSPAKNSPLYASLRSLCMGSCRPVAFGVNAQCDTSSAATCLPRSEPNQSSVCVTSRRICRDRNR